MSAIASATVLPPAALAQLQTAATPVQRFLRAPRDDFPAVLKRTGHELPPYNGDGFVFATLLPYLKDRGIDLLTSEHDGVARQLCKARGASLFVLTPAQRAAALVQLDDANFTVADLQTYYERFNERSAPGAGVAMMEGIRFLRSVLQAITPTTVALLQIG